MRHGLLALCLLSASCWTPTEPPAPAHVGAYHLRSVDGHGLPFSIVETDSVTIQIQGRTMELQADGTFRDEVVLKVTAPRVSTTLVDRGAGTYEAGSQGLSLAFHGGPTLPAALVGGHLDLLERGVLFRLSR